MLTVAEAQKCVCEQVQALPAMRFSQSVGFQNLVLAEDVVSDLDLPPFDKAMMDGYAVRAADFVNGKAELSVIEEVMAGQVPRKALGQSEATRIMTGAPVPIGADAVVMVERSVTDAAGRVRIDDPSLRAGQNILRRGLEMARGQVILRAGARLRPQEYGLLHAAGRPTPLVIPPAMAGVAATGDELVPADAVPGPGQIRNSNAAMLMAQVQRAGGVPYDLGIARDNLDSLHAVIAHGLRFDVLILAGGVSAGKLDLVPQALAEQGVQTLFHKVAMKPGKPVLFGIKPRTEGPGPPCLVFGLPGNPVSAMVCAELFVRPALRGLMGRPPGPRMVDAALAGDHVHRSDRPTYHPACLRSTAAGWSVQPVPWIGAPDLRGVSAANAFVLLPPGERVLRAGEMFPVLCVEDGE